MLRTTTTQRKLPRLFWQGELVADTSIVLERTQAHYLLDVMRKKVGDKLRLFNGKDGEWQASISDATRKRCQLMVEDQLRSQSEALGPTLLVAPIKKARMEMLIEKATELGVGRLMPVKSRRSIVDKINTQRLNAIAIEAAEQCERLTVPKIDELQTLKRRLSDWSSDRPLYVADESGHGDPILKALQPNHPAAFLIGPEGGFDPNELHELSEHPAVVKVDLGPRILRAETAAIVALACLSAKI